MREFLCLVQMRNNVLLPTLVVRDKTISIREQEEFVQRCRTVKLQSPKIAKKDCSHPTTTHKVGDSVDSDIKGGLHVGLSAILYSPTARESRRLLFGEEAPVIRHMSQLLEHLSVTNSQFEPSFVSWPEALVIEGIGIDSVTRDCLHI
jgi:hypothetical protein